jgi:hypothetical protein
MPWKAGKMCGLGEFALWFQVKIYREKLAAS